MIPAFDPATGYLPPGQHDATWSDIVATYAYTPHRRAILAGLRAALDNLASAGCRRVYLNGSFVTAKLVPGDYDLCYDPAGIDFTALDRIIAATGRSRHILQLAKYRGDLVPSTAVADLASTQYVHFFQKDENGTPKGILVVDLGSDT